MSRLLVVCLILGVFSCSDSQVVAIVGPEKITLEELNEFSRAKAMMLGVESLTPEQREEVLEALIQREVVYLHARKTGVVKISEEQIEEAAKDLSLLQRLRYRRDIEKNLMLEEMKGRFTHKTVSEAEVREYYRANREGFAQPERYRVYLVRVEGGIAPHVLEKARKNPGAFGDMALRTETPELRRINENAPFAPKEDFPAEMWPFLEKMEVGDIAGPVNVERGTFLFKLVDRKPARELSYTEAYFTIEHSLTAKKRQEAFESWVKAVGKNYRIERRLKDLRGDGEKG